MATDTGAPAGFGAVALLLEAVLTELRGLRADFAAVATAPAAPAKAAEPEGGLWDADDLASYLKASRSWVYDAAAADRIPSIHVSGMLRFDPAAIKAWAKGRSPGRVLPMRRA
jgi:predicted DNA-binding transcriptional regulator AlpA